MNIPLTFCCRGLYRANTSMVLLVFRVISFSAPFIIRMFVIENTAKICLFNNNEHFCRGIVSFLNDVII